MLILFHSDVDTSPYLFPQATSQADMRTCWHAHLAVLCASGMRLAPTEVERRPAAMV